MRAPGDPPRLDRRTLLLGAAMAGGAGAAVAGDARAPAAAPLTASGTLPWRAGYAEAPDAATKTGYVYFTPAEALLIEAAVDRLIPADAHGEGAKGAGVPVFIDRQLAGPYGRGDHFYLQGPWAKGLPTQGWQSRYGPAQMYRAALWAIDDHASRAFGGLFHTLSAVDQDKLLSSLEDGSATLATVESKAFFTLLLQNTTEGFFSDPIYGGNRDMVAWKMIGFPGSHYDYSEWIHRHGEPWPYPPVGLQGRPEWSRG